MKKRVIIHAGTAKTGSTSIQYGCYQGADWLRMFSVSYRETRLFAFNHRNEINCNAFPESQLTKQYFDCVLRGESGSNDIRKIREIVLEPFLSSNDQILVVSLEHFTGNFFHNLDYYELMPGLIQSLFSSNEVELHVVFYLRQQAQLIAALYSEQFRCASKEWTLDVEQFCNERINYRQYDWLKLVQVFESAFGRDAIHVRHYESARLLKNGVLEDFFNVIKSIGPIRYAHRATQKMPWLSNIDPYAVFNYWLENGLKLKKKAVNRSFSSDELSEILVRAKTLSRSELYEFVQGLQVDDGRKGGAKPKQDTDQRLARSLQASAAIVLSPYAERKINAYHHRNNELIQQRYCQNLVPERAWQLGGLDADGASRPCSWAQPLDSARIHFVNKSDTN